MSKKILIDNTKIITQEELDAVKEEISQYVDDAITAAISTALEADY